MSNERYPYHFTNSQIDEIGFIISEKLPENNSLLIAVNNEIGIAKTREMISEVQHKVSAVLGLGDNYTALMLTDEEVSALVKFNLTEAVKGILRDELH